MFVQTLNKFASILKIKNKRTNVETTISPQTLFCKYFSFIFLNRPKLIITANNVAIKISGCQKLKKGSVKLSIKFLWNKHRIQIHQEYHGKNLL